MAKITLGRYMWERIHQIGVDTIFGVPGDFNLQFLDPIDDVKGLNWLGNQNELNAAYAADGYARVKGVPGVYVTTHGVGELSAINGVAGAMSEHVKMIHIVGQTTRAMQKNNLMIHHSIGPKPDHQLYNHVAKSLRFAAAELWDVETAPAEIDRIIRECFLKAGPVYIFMPLDLSAEEVSANLLETPIDLTPKFDSTSHEKAIAALVDAIKTAQNPSILIDRLAQEFGAASEARALVAKLNVPSYAATGGKGVIDETHKSYIGVYNGDVGHPGVATAARTSDLMITVGLLPADTNSGGFSRKIDNAKAIHIGPFEVVVKGQTFSNIAIKPFLAALNEALPLKPFHNIPRPSLPSPRIPKDKDATHITQSWLWPQLEKLFSTGDIIIGETGTTVFGLQDIKFPADARWLTQCYYGSIGFATPATLGAEVARREMDGQLKRTILITGDGSMAMTIQEIGTMIKAGTKPIIFVINNDGYTVERMIWGAKRAYNDIVPTDYSHLLPLFKHPSADKSYHLAKDKKDLEAILASKDITEPQSLQLVEVLVPKLDTSWRLGAQLAWRGEESKQYLDREGFVDVYGNWGLEGGSNGAVKWA